MIKEEDKQYLNNPDYSLPLEKFFAPEFYTDLNDKDFSNFYGGRIQTNNGVVLQAYPYSNEKIAGIYKNFKNYNKILTIGSSGDQALQGIFGGAKDVTIADLNIFTKYWVDYKIAAIKNLSFREFRDCFRDEEGFNNLDMAFDYSTYKKIFHDLDEDSATFWGTLFMEGAESSRIYAEMLQRDDVNICSPSCEFYVNKKEYKKMQELLRRGEYNLNFINADFTDFPEVLKEKYDTILLSNVCRYVREEKFAEVVNRLYENNLVDGGNMQLHYSFSRFVDIVYTLNAFKKYCSNLDVKTITKNLGVNMMYAVHKPKLMEAEESVM